MSTLPPGAKSFVPCCIAQGGGGRVETYDHNADEHKEAQTASTAYALCSRLDFTMAGLVLGNPTVETTQTEIEACSVLNF
jgi:hypothetical protein